MSGGEFVSFNNAVFLSERENADRNYALACNETTILLIYQRLIDKC
jgi:hypothetical protein